MRISSDKKTSRLSVSHIDGAVVDAYGELTVVAGGSTLEVEQMDESTGRWYIAGDMKDAIGGKITRFNHFSLAAINHKVFCFGGIQGNNKSPTSMVYTMDLQTKEWSLYGECR